MHNITDRALRQGKESALKLDLLVVSKIWVSGGGGIGEGWVV